MPPRRCALLLPLAWLLSIVAGCDHPAACGPSGECPSPLTCVEGLCRNTLGVAVGGSDATVNDASCPSDGPLDARAFAAAAPFAAGLAVVGGEPVADSCQTAPPTATGANARIAACGGFAALPPLPALAEGPANRVGAMAAEHPGDGSLWLVGGRSGVDEDQPSGEVLRLQPGATAWTQATAPVSARSHGALVATSSPKALWLFGGDIGPGGTPIATAELRKLAVPSTTWQLAVAGGELPGARRNFASTSLGDRVALFGGADAGDASTADVHLLHAASLTWKRVSVTGPTPGPRIDAALVGMGTDQLLLFGGDEEGWGPRNDLWRLDLQLGAWTRLRAGDRDAAGRTDTTLAPVDDVCAPPAALLTPSTTDPEARAGVALIRLAGGDLLLFGGRGRCGPLADLWRLDASSAGWARIRAGGGGLCPLRADSCAHLCSGATP